MPSTVNGIGTHYYGKKNVQKRLAACHSCGQTVELVSYDTRLWFVIVFIPIIPLGRKRILDQCPACTRHYVVEAVQWETMRQLEVSGAQELFRTQPTAENAIALHQKLLHFHQLDEAVALQTTMVGKFSDNAKVHLYLGDAMTHLGRLKEATPFYARAVKLRADLPEARAGLALGHIRDGRLDEARAMLDFLEKPGASKLYPLEPLNTLAKACQEANRHDVALSLFAILLREVPSLGEEKWFRDLVSKSEKKSGVRDSLLPKQKFSWKRLFSIQTSAGSGASTELTWRHAAIVGVILAVVAIGFIIANEYIRCHRTLHIISGFKTPAVVEVRGVGKVTVGGQPVELSVKEGRHHASITGPVNQEVDFEVRGDYWGRWTDDAAWVLNVGGSALLQTTTAVYAKNGPPPRFEFHFGEPFFRLNRVTHPFRELPPSLQMKEGESRTLVELSRFPGEPVVICYHLIHEKNLPEAMRLAEWRLKLEPGDERMLGGYLVAARAHQQLPRAETFLGAGLTNRPVAIQWHRVYQGLRSDAARDLALAAEYDRQLSVDPSNAALIYLRGRVTLDRAERRAWFERASQADEKNPFPIFALGYDHLRSADLKAARLLFERACALQPREEGFVEAFLEVRTGLREYAELEKELRQRLVAEPASFVTLRRLCDVLVAAGRKEDAGEAIRHFEAGLKGRDGEDIAAAKALVRRHWLYASGDFGALEKDAAADHSEAGNQARYAALVELGRMDEATKLFPLEAEGIEDPFHFLNMAVAFRLAGDRPVAERWQARALALLDAGDADRVRAAAALRKSTPPTEAELDEAALPIESKATLLAALAQIHPSRRAAFSEQARRLNLAWSFPHHLLERATVAGP